MCRPRGVVAMQSSVLLLHIICTLALRPMTRFLAVLPTSPVDTRRGCASLRYVVRATTKCFAWLVPLVCVRVCGWFTTPSTQNWDLMLTFSYWGVGKALTKLMCEGARLRSALTRPPDMPSVLCVMPASDPVSSRSVVGRRARAHSSISHLSSPQFPH